jgi:hypothetical protein
MKADPSRLKEVEGDLYNEVVIFLSNDAPVPRDGETHRRPIEVVLSEE